jgi:glycosyltransferase involved in cell wall biosynthesis
MHVLHLNTSDIEGGAARAAFRLHIALQSTGIKSQMLVRAKTSVDNTVIGDRSILTQLGPRSNGLPLKLYRLRDRTMFSPQWFPDVIANRVRQINPDIVHIHWICNGYLKIESLTTFKQPIVWTLHDMWPLTGGCHTSQSCLRYQNSCGACPQLHSHQEWDLSRWIWKRKAKAWKDLNLTIIAPSSWLARCTQSSSLFQNCRVEVIPHGLDLAQYKPIEREIARSLLNLPQDKKLIHFGSGSVNDPNKGFSFLISALQRLCQNGWQDRIELVVFGASKPEHSIDLGIKIHYFERLHDNLSLSLVYSSSDVLVVPSKQESFGQTASESLACGTPVVAFNTTGLQDIVDHEQNGYLAEPYNPEDLARGIAWILEDGDRRQSLSHRAREKALTSFSLDLMGRRHVSLDEEILKK